MSAWSRCTLCPRLCRSACPVALGSGREAAVPAVMASILLQVERGDVPASLAAEAMTLCTDCGACQDHCHLDTPLPEALRDARAQALPDPVIEPLQPVRGRGGWVAIESDERTWAQELSDVLGEPVRTWRTADHLGVAALHRPGNNQRAARIKQALDNTTPVVISGGVAAVLTDLEIPHKWLREVVPQLPGGRGSCCREGAKPLACCGAAGPLSAHHPDDAVRVGKLWLDRTDDWTVADARCRSHLRACGGEVTDPLDALLAGAFVR